MRKYHLFAILICLLLIDLVSSLDKQRDCKCRIQSNRRIVGGRNAGEMSYPWVVTLSYKEESLEPEHLRKQISNSEKIKLHKCGGIIINENWILTAGHCVDGLYGKVDANDTQVGYGETDLLKFYDLNKYVQIETAYRHPNYSGSFEVSSDLALLKLKKPLVFSKSVQPACLDLTPRTLYNGVLKMAGWGMTVPQHNYFENNGTASRFLKEGEVYDRTHPDTCNELRTICVANERTHDAGCMGDSGGPLMSQSKNGKSSIIGVFSEAGYEGEDTPDSFKICVGKTVFARLSPASDWITSLIGQDYCS